VNDKQILITGATNGIGLAAAEALAALGANVAIVGRSKQDAGCLGPHQGGGRERSDGGHIRL
jgi:NAD(P)-dependent dehydrogenase (short-subunit alcohol dehydrogenase family)